MSDLQRNDYVLTDEEISGLVDKCVKFGCAATETDLYPYQLRLMRRILNSLMTNDGAEISALFARQGGKTETIAVTVATAMVLLPTFAKMPYFGDDIRIAKFKKGLRVGMFAPTQYQVDKIKDRTKARMQSESMREIFKEEFDWDLPEYSFLNLPNGSFVDARSCGPNTKSEGGTFELIICEECQDIDDFKILKSIHPTGAAVNATLIKIGTPTTRKGNFYDVCHRNKREGKFSEKAINAKPNHFEANYETISQHNPNYRLYLERELKSMDYDSDEFKLAYRLIWLIERGKYLNVRAFEECGIEDRDVMKVVDEKDKRKVKKFTRPAYPPTNDRSTDQQVASIDWGKTTDSTVVTVAKVFWDNPIYINEEQVRYFSHVQNWFEIQGDEHEEQLPAIYNFLDSYKIGKIICDATGRGDPLFSAIRLHYKPKDIIVEPFVFSSKSKNDGYKLMSQEIAAQRLTYPAGPGAQRQTKWRRFVKQMVDLEKSYRGNYMVVEAPRSGKRGRSASDSAHDDYCDSLMMLCYCINHDADARPAEIEIVDNLFLSPGAIAGLAGRQRNSITKNSRHRRRRGRRR